MIIKRLIKKLCSRDNKLHVHQPVRYVSGDVWEVDSSDASIKPYHVYADDVNGWWCECRGYMYSRKPKTCQHIGKVIRASGMIPVIRGADDDWLQEYVRYIHEGEPVIEYTGRVEERQGKGWSMRVHY